MQTIVKRGRKFTTYQGSGDGKRVTEITLHDQHYPVGDAWLPVNTNWRRQGTGFIADRMNHIIRVKRNGARVWFPRRGVTDECVKLGGIEYQDAGGQWQALSIVSQQADGDTVFLHTRNGVTVLIHSTWSGVKADYVLADSTAPTRFRFTVELDGLREDDGWLYGADGEQVGKLSPTLAWDADGHDLTCQSTLDDGVVVFGVDTHGAAFPVTLDPDYAGSTADGRIYGDNATYSIARSTAINVSTSVDYLYAGQSYGSGTYRVRRSFLKFDTSAIGTDTVTQVNLKLWLENYYNDDDFDVEIVKQDWSSQDPLDTDNMEAAFDNCLSGTLDGVWQNTADLGADGYYTSENLDTTWVETGGNTYYSIRSSRDVSGDIVDDEYVVLISANYFLSSRRPVLVVAHEEASASTDALTSEDVTSGIPVVDKGTLGQEHALTSQDVASDVPTVDKPTLAEANPLDGQDIASGVPTVDKPTLGQEHAITAQDVAAGDPTVDKGTLGQEHALTGQDVASDVPTVDKATIGQEHGLTGQDVTSGIPSVGLPTLGQIHALTAQDIAFGIPAIDQSTPGQVHALTGLGVASGIPTVDKGTVGQVSAIYELTGQDVASAAPTVDKPTLTHRVVVRLATPARRTQIGSADTRSYAPAAESRTGTGSATSRTVIGTIDDRVEEGLVDTRT